MSIKFGPFIREKRIKKGLGQRELAAKIGVSASYLSDIDIPKVKLTKRENYGYKTIDNRCWLEANCYEGSDVLIYKSIFGYKFIKRSNKFDRASLYQ